MTAAGERREFFRIKDRLEIEFRLLENDEFLRLEQIIKYNPTQVFAQPQKEKVKKSAARKMMADEETIVSFLTAIDRKLSVITDLLTKSADDLYCRRYVDVDISGSGLSFISDVLLPENGYVELRLLLPLFPYPRIPVLCKVMRSLKREENAHVAWETACKFLTINDADRDLLIQYIFGREREKIRSAKELGDR